MVSKYTFKPLKANMVSDLVAQMERWGQEGWHSAGMLAVGDDWGRTYVAVMEKEVNEDEDGN